MLSKPDPALKISFNFLALLINLLLIFTPLRNIKTLVFIIFSFNLCSEIFGRYSKFFYFFLKI